MMKEKGGTAALDKSVQLQLDLSHTGTADLRVLPYCHQKKEDCGAAMITAHAHVRGSLKTQL